MEAMRGVFLNTHFKGTCSNTTSTGRSAGRRRVRPPSLVAGTLTGDTHAPILCFGTMLHASRLGCAWRVQSASGEYCVVHLSLESISVVCGARFQVF